MTKLRTIPFDLSTDRRDQATGVLNDWLPSLIDLALCLKQAHWNLRGERFRSVHEHLDEILADVRTAVDDVAERAVTLGGQADGRPQTVTARSRLPEFPAGLLTVEQAIDASCAHLGAVIDAGRTAVFDDEREARRQAAAASLSSGPSPALVAEAARLAKQDVEELKKQTKQLMRIGNLLTNQQGAGGVSTRCAAAICADWPATWRCRRPPGTRRIGCWPRPIG